MTNKEYIGALDARLVEGRKVIAERVQRGIPVVNEFRTIATQEGRLIAIRRFAEGLALPDLTREALRELDKDMQSCCSWGGW